MSDNDIHPRGRCAQLWLMGFCFAALLSPTSALAAAGTGSDAECPHWQYIIACALLVLLAILFVLVFRWMHRLEKGSYMGQIYSDTVRDLEYNRHRGRIDKRRNDGEFDRQAKQVLWDRYEQVMASKPPRPEELDQYVGKARGREDDTETTRGDYDDPWESDPLLLLDPSEIPVPHRGLLKDYKEKKRAYLKSRSDIWQQRQKLETQLYNTELDKANEMADAVARREADVDIGAIRGRGPSFILQFTAVVVIVFLVALLGVLEILREEQIGTLLAAIAGYVLGRATDGQSEQAEARRAPSRPDGNNEDHPPANGVQSREGEAVTKR